MAGRIKIFAIAYKIIYLKLKTFTTSLKMYNSLSNKMHRGIRKSMKKTEDSIKLEIGNTRTRSMGAGKDYSLVQELWVLDDTDLISVDSLRSFIADETGYEIVIIKMSKLNSAPPEYPAPVSEYQLNVIVPIPKVVDLTDKGFLSQMATKIVEDVFSSIQLM
ncbi:MAG: hypothetical protein ACI9N9_002187 [Enterobacterales bacterium]